MKHRYTAIADTPLLIRAKKSYFQSSDVSMLHNKQFYHYHEAGFIIVLNICSSPSSSSAQPSIKL